MKTTFRFNLSLIIAILCLPILSWGQVYRVDSTFNTGTGFNRTISDKVVQPDGKVLVSGGFSTVNGVPRSGLVRLNLNGSVDTSFLPPENYIESPYRGEIVSNVGLQSDGKIIITVFRISSGITWTKNLDVNRLHPNGLRDSSFQRSLAPAPEFDYSQLLSMKILANNSIILGGSDIYFNVNYYLPQSAIYAHIWPMYENGLNIQTLQNALDVIGDVKSTEFLPNGKILIGGNLQTFRGRVVSNLVQFNADYTLDTTFNYRSFRDTTGYISDVKALPNGKLVALGNFTSYNGTPCKNIALLNSNGVLDSLNSTLGSGFNNEVTSMMLRPDGKLILGGTFTSYNGVNVPKLIRVYPNGNLDTTFRPDAAFLAGVQNPVYTLMADGNILVSGRISADTNTRIWKLTFEPCSNVNAPIITGENSFCQGGYTTLTSSIAAGYLWSTGDTSRFITVAMAGNYSVRAINATCTTAASNSFQVVNRGPSPTRINFDTTTNRCLGTRIQLTPAGNYAYYQWSNGETTRSIYTRTSGQYSVQVANADSCFGLPSPPIFVVLDTVWCTVEISRVGIDSITASVWADSYIWYLDGIELLTSNTRKTIPIQGYGVYTFRAVNGTRISPLSNPIIVTSVNQNINAPKVKVYPNPATGKVSITTSPDAETVSFRNAIGQLVFTTKAQPNMELNLSSFAKGMYLVQVIGKEGITTERLIIQ